ncbi:hypothetical protein RCL1_004847 [Eukaryota sp. TZLM3-RCL]
MKLLLVALFAFVVFAHDFPVRPIGDELCQIFDPESYCKWWQKPDGIVCQGSDIPCDGRKLCPKFDWTDRRFDVLKGAAHWSGLYMTHFFVPIKLPVSAWIQLDGKGGLSGNWFHSGASWHLEGKVDEKDKVVIEAKRIFITQKWEGKVYIDEADPEYLVLDLELVHPKPHMKTTMIIKTALWCINYTPKTNCPPCSYCKFWQDPMVCQRTDEPCFDKKFHHKEL